MSILRNTLRFIGAVQLFLGSFFLLAPEQFANLFDLQSAPMWVNWLFAMMGARFIGYAIGMFLAARNPQQYRTWIATMIGIQAIDWFATIFYLLADAVTLAQVTTAAFLPVLFILVLVIYFPSQSTSPTQ